MPEFFATKHTITVTLRDYKGKMATVKVNRGTSINDAKQLADQLKDRSQAAVISYSHTESSYVDDDKTSDTAWLSGMATEHYDRCEQKCKFMFLDCDNGERFSISVPAPADSCFDADQEANSDVAKDFMQAIANCTTREAANLLFMGGGLTGKLPKMRKTKMTGM